MKPYAQLNIISFKIGVIRIGIAVSKAPFGIGHSVGNKVDTGHSLIGEFVIVIMERIGKIALP